MQNIYYLTDNQHAEGHIGNYYLTGLTAVELIPVINAWLVNFGGQLLIESLWVDLGGGTVDFAWVADDFVYEQTFYFWQLEPGPTI